MHWRPVAAVMLRQFYLMRGSLSRVLPLFMWVAIDMVLWGFITKYLNTVTTPGLRAVPMLLGAALFWNFFGRVMQGVTIGFFEDVWSRNFLNIFATPMSIVEYITGLVLTTFLSSLVALAAMVLLAQGLFDLPFFSYGIHLFSILATLFLFGIALGVFACGVVLRFGPSAEWFVWPIPAVLSPFAGVFYPLSTLPPWMQGLAHVLPPSYVFEDLRLIAAGLPPSPTGYMMGGALGVLYVMAGGWFFVHTYKGAVRSGLIARYSAESVA